MTIASRAVSIFYDRRDPDSLLRDTLRLCELIVGMECHLADSVKQLEQRVDALADQIRADREE